MIALLTSSLHAGGTQRVVLRLAEHWRERGRAVTLVTLADPSTDFYDVPHGLERYSLGGLAASGGHVGGIRRNARRVAELGRLLDELAPDALLGFLPTSNVLAILAARRRDVPVVVSERNDPRHNPLPLVWKAVRRVTYPWADAVTVQTEAVAGWARRFVAPERVHVIPNPVVPPDRDTDPADLDGPTVVSMGALTHQKGFDLLLRAFARATEDRPDWRLLILGEGPERADLEALARDLGVADRVEMPGLVDEPDRVLRDADLFVLSSRYEGFPNALLEAMACGLAVVSTDCPSGPGEIVTDGEDGRLVPPEDVPRLAGAMEELMTSESVRRDLGKRARDIVDRYRPEDVLDRWDDLVSEVRQG